MYEILIGAAVTGVIGIIGYFLKQTMNRVDRHEDEIKNVREAYTPKELHNRDFDECKKDIKKIKEDYIMKEDFYREISKVDRKLDYISDMMLKIIEKKGD